MLKLNDIELYELGNQIQIAGMILQGNSKTLAVMFPEADLDVPELVEMDNEDWKTLFLQLDTLETKLFPNNPNSKIIVRKSQRNIEQGVSWRVFKRDNYKCRYCATDDVPLTVDHVVLWEDMGQTMEDNLISACRKCNKTRGNMKFLDWLNSDYYNKVMTNVHYTRGLFSVRHKLNLDAWEKANKLPLREALRSR